MTKITETTTLAELQLQAAKDGISLITIRFEDTNVLAGLQFSDRGEHKFVVGTGNSIHTALDEAFEKMRVHQRASFGREAQ